jgi:hypothetical protein
MLIGCGWTIRAHDWLVATMHGFQSHAHACVGGAKTLSFSTPSRLTLRVESILQKGGGAGQSRWRILLHNHNDTADNHDRSHRSSSTLCFQNSYSTSRYKRAPALLHHESTLCCNNFLVKRYRDRISFVRATPL